MCALSPPLPLSPPPLSHVAAQREEQVLKLVRSDKGAGCECSQGAKRGDLLEIEYTGKLEDGNVFDGSSIKVNGAQPLKSDTTRLCGLSALIGRFSFEAMYTIFHHTEVWFAIPRGWRELRTGFSSALFTKKLLFLHLSIFFSLLSSLSLVKLFAFPCRFTTQRTPTPHRVINLTNIKNIQTHV